MNKISLFLKMYRKKHLENTILFLLFTLLAATVSMVLFVQENHTQLLQNQAAVYGMEIDRDSFTIQGTENILGFIAIAAMFVGAAGTMCLIGFRNQSRKKAVVMMHIYGMTKQDLAVKALVDAAIYALSSFAGCGLGYVLFLHFSRNILHTDTVLLFSVSVFLKTFVLISFIVFFGNLYTDFRLTEQVVQILYQRKGSRKKHHFWIPAVTAVGMILYSLFVFHIKKKYLFVAGMAAAILTGILFFVFHLFFCVFTKQRRRSRKIKTINNLGFCFLCSRNRRDALLSIVISAGTVLLCIVANIVFNTSGMLRSAYRDNMGYTIAVLMDDFNKQKQVKEKLDETGIIYTFAYSRLVDYSQLNGMQGEEGAFWAFLVEDQTDGNFHFSVPENSFLAENYFYYRCGCSDGEITDIFGAESVCLGHLTDNQYLGLVPYSFVLNSRDWKYGVDDTWDAVFLIDATVEEEEKIRQELNGFSCHVESASSLIEELVQLLKDYLDIILLLCSMLVLVTVSIFYTVIANDLTERKTELYLYKIFGASPVEARKVVFYEYTEIALVSSLAVSFTVMVCAELYFYFGLKKHFPLSIPVILLTTAAAVIFIFACCAAAGYINEKRTGTEVIRDE